MARHILAIGTRQANQQPSHYVMDKVAAITRSSPGFQVIRCASPGELVAKVARARGEDLVDILDIFDHGAAGLQRLGDAMVFRATGNPGDPLVGGAIAADLQQHLSQVAHVRLLGCSTATDLTPQPGHDGITAAGSAGRLLLYKLAVALNMRDQRLSGRRLVFGTIRLIDDRMFASEGFKRKIENEFLFSSTAALDLGAPSPKYRIDQLHQLDPPPR